MQVMKSRFFRRSLLSLLVIMLAVLAIDYLFIINYAAKAKQDSISERQQSILAQLGEPKPELAQASAQSLEELLQQVALKNGLHYLLLASTEGALIAHTPDSLKPEQQHTLMGDIPSVRSGSEQLVENVVVLGGEPFFNATLPVAPDAIIVYGLPLREVKKAEEQAYRLNRYLLIFLITLLAAYMLRRFHPHKLMPAGLAIAPEDQRLIDQMHILSENMGDGMLLIKQNGDVQHYNEIALNILHVEVPQAGKTAPNIYRLLDSTKIQPEQATQIRNFLHSEDKTLEIEFKKSGAPVGFEINYIPCPPYSLYILRDLTDKKNCATLLSRTNEMLEQAIEQRTKELMVVNEQLRRENTERRAVEEALLKAESRYREIVDNSIEGIFQRAPDGRLLTANPAAARILGYSSVEELLARYSEPGGHLSYTSEMEYAITELLDVRGWVSNLEFQAVMQDGNPVWVAMNARRVADSTGEALYYEAFIEDITSRKKTEEKLVHQAFHDPLTGLPNRALFLDRLRMALRRTKRHPEYLFAVLYLDLDRFKNINDTFGHSAGDKMLKHATEKLLQCVREADTVARFGGDEFAVLLTDLEKPAQAVFITKRISEAFNDTISFHGQDVSIGASIGIVLSNKEYDTPEEILRDADTAMYRAKMHGRRCFTVFNRRMREETIEALAMENDLRYAVERREIEAYYQPLVQIEHEKVYGFEALMRWRRSGEIIGPATFIPIAEETGVINDLGLEMLRIVCRQIVEWNKTLNREDYSVHVNISGKQLMANLFWRDVQKILEETGVNPRQLIFEITESVFLDYGTQVINAMNIIREYGIRFCLDDFGTGFSSLSYLRLLPLESLKLDRSFITDLHNDRFSEAILRNLISMGNDLGLDVITEGVDLASQVGVLLSVGCVYAQGYYFSRPLTATVAIDYIRTHGTTGESPKDILL